MLFPFFARSIAGKLKSPLCNDERRRRDGKISIFSRYIHQNSRHVANLDASASTSSISNNTREKNDIAVHRFFSLSPLLSLSKFPFSKRWSTLIEYFIARLKHRVRDNFINPDSRSSCYFAPLKYAKYSPSKREIPSICIHLECKLVCEWKERALFSTRPSFQPLFILFCPFVSFSS